MHWTSPSPGSSSLGAALKEVVDSGMKQVNPVLPECPGMQVHSSGADDPDAQAADLRGSVPLAGCDRCARMRARESHRLHSLRRLNGSLLIRDLEVRAAACRDRVDQGLQRRGALDHPGRQPARVA